MLRVLCALALAVVTTFHVCGATRGKVVDVVTLSADMDNGCSTSLKAIEKCHTCALASLPAHLAAAQVAEVGHVIPVGATLQVSAFQQPAIGPPPRA